MKPSACRHRNQGREARTFPEGADAGDVVYSNNFDAENGGKSAKNYQAFRGLTVTYPVVDLVHTANTNGIACTGGTGGCINLDGGGPRQVVSDVFNFKGGDTVSWTFSAGDSQNASSPLDTTYYAFRSGRFRFLFDAFNNDGTDFDGARRIINNVALDISAVPELATWALMILSFALVGFGLRWTTKQSGAGFEVGMKQAYARIAG